MKVMTDNQRKALTVVAGDYLRGNMTPFRVSINDVARALEGKSKGAPLPAKRKQAVDVLMSLQRQGLLKMGSYEGVWLTETGIAYVQSSVFTRGDVEY